MAGAGLLCTVLALISAGSVVRTAINPSEKAPAPPGEAKSLNDRGIKLLSAGSFQDAHDAFRSAALLAQRKGIYGWASTYWSNAGACSNSLQKFRAGLDEFRQARATARRSGQAKPMLGAMNNLAILYIHMGQFAQAIQVAEEALSGPAAHADAKIRAKLLCQLAGATMDIGQFDRAKPVYREAIAELMDHGDLDSAARAWGAFGNDSIRAGHADDAEWALSEALRLLRTHPDTINGNASANILSGLAKLKSLQGDSRSAESLFAAALAAPPNSTPRWRIFADRAQSRLNAGDLRGALADSREARAIAARMRLDVVPADQDRIALEGGLSDIMEVLVNAGNRLAIQSGDRGLLQETFDAAGQDRLWSLRALVPSPNDWRTRLPDRYWDLLLRSQSLERSAMGRHTTVIEKNAAVVRAELQRIEAAAAAGAGPQTASAEPQTASAEPQTASAEPLTASAEPLTMTGSSALLHVQRTLDDDSVFFSFQVSKTSSWVWAVDRRRVDVFRLPELPALRAKIEKFQQLVKDRASSSVLGRDLYSDLFGCIPQLYRQHARWLLELDGPLHQLPFAALVTGENPDGPEYLIERVSLQTIPNALLLERGSIPSTGGFVGVGDPVYNSADSRYQGSRRADELLLTRLPNTAGEVQACALAWKSRSGQVLTGPDAEPGNLRRALLSNPAILHFATHVVTAPGEFRSGMIALSLDGSGTPSLLGPKEIVARPVGASLVVMDGCHSGQGEALPSSGLMGLTRAWIGAGAKAVLATQWDIPDDAAQALMVRFYAGLRAAPQRGTAAALRQAQLAEVRKDRATPGRWAGYFLLSKIA